MDFTDFRTGKDDCGRRLDKVIRIFIPDQSLSNIYQAMRKGLIKVNSKRCKPDYKIADGDLLSIADILIKKEPAPLQKTQVQSGIYKIRDLIVFENAHILILNKPRGINVHKAFKDDMALADLVQDYYLATRQNQSLSFKPGPLHRLDKMTGGLICFSMTLEGARWFSQELEKGQIKKTYSATIEGLLNQKESWQDYILKENEDGDDFHTVKVISGSQKSIPDQAKICITHIIPRESLELEGKTYTRASFLIETGRQHQIRAQSAFHGHPLAGDTAYGAAAGPLDFDLCAVKLEFPQNDLAIPLEINLL